MLCGETSASTVTDSREVQRLGPLLCAFDLIITDVNMPEITGIEFAWEMLSLRTYIPIIMCTGFSQLIDADATNAAGVRAFAMKPLTKRGIAKTIRTVLDG
jgi:DNA-binding NarL/FixJ family response regulator